jgi:hypothetical protein
MKSLRPSTIVAVSGGFVGMALSDPEERRSFDFFYRLTVPSLGVYFINDLWTTLALHSPNLEPAIIHSSLAISSFHECFVSKGHIFDEKKNPESQRFAKSQHIKAVTILRKRLNAKDQPVEMTLICCIMFIWLETISGNYPSALKHYASGTELLRFYSKQQNRTNGTKGVMKSNWYLVDYYIASIFSGPLLDFKTSVVPDFDGKMPDLFSSIVQARSYLNILYIKVLIFMKSTFRVGFSENKFILTSKSRLHALLRSWEAAFQGFSDRQIRAPIPDLTEIAIDHLELHYSSLTVMLCVSLSYPTMELSPDSPIPEISRLRKPTATMISPLMCAFLTSNKLTHPLPSFAHDMGVVIPIYAIAVKCQNPVARSMAMQLLGMKPVRKSIWGGDMEGVGDAPWAKHVDPSKIVQMRYIASLMHLGEKSWPPIVHE